MDHSADTPTVVAQDNGSVTVTPGKDSVKVVTTFVDENDQPQTVISVKQPDGTWVITDGGQTGATINPVTGEVTIPANKVKDGSTVTATASDESGNTATATAVAKGAPVAPAAPNLKATTGTGKMLPNTGDETSSMTILGTGILFGAAFFTRRKKRQEEVAEDDM